MVEQYPRDKSIHQVLAEVVHRDPERVALVLDSQRITYRRLDDLASGLAARLVAVGLQTGDRVAVLADRSIETMIAYVAILKAGGAYVPIDVDYPSRRVAFLLNDCAPAAVLTQRAYRPKLADKTGPIIELDDLIAEHDACPLALPAREVGPADLAYILYTSGTTGNPKGVAVPHRAVVRLVFGQDYATFGPQRTFLQLASLSFDAATFELWGPLLHGGTCVLYPGGSLPDPAQLQRCIHDQRVTTCWLTASLFNTIINVMPEALADLDELLIGGEALSVVHVKRAQLLLPSVQIINGYGPTENTTFTCCYRIPRDLSADLASIPIGFAIANTDVSIVDEDFAPVTPGEVGEIVCGGDGLADGYWNRDDLTRAAFFVPTHPALPKERMYRTGDYGRLLPDGAIEFLGRRDDQVKIRGFRIEPAEITAVLLRHKLIRDAAVVAQDRAGTMTLTAYVVPVADPLTPDELREYLEQHIGEYMIPADFACLPALPLTANGKLDRSQLPAPSKERPGRDVLTPGTATEQTLTHIWSKLLKLPNIGVDMNFFDVGGTSLLSIELVSEIQKAFVPKQQLSVVQVYQYPTIRDFAAFLTDSLKPATPAMSARERAARQRQSFQRRPGR